MGAGTPVEPPHGAIQWAGVGDAAAVQVVISGSGALLGLKMAEE
jgi:hypothetical protein